MCSQLGTLSTSQAVPWLGIELVTLWFTGQHSIHWAKAARSYVNVFFIPSLSLLFRLSLFPFVSLSSILPFSSPSFLSSFSGYKWWLSEDSTTAVNSLGARFALGWGYSAYPALAAPQGRRIPLKDTHTDNLYDAAFAGVALLLSLSPTVVSFATLILTLDSLKILLPSWSWRSLKINVQNEVYMLCVLLRLEFSFSRFTKDFTNTIHFLYLQKSFDLGTSEIYFQKTFPSFCIISFLSHPKSISN